MDLKVRNRNFAGKKWVISDAFLIPSMENAKCPAPIPFIWHLYHSFRSHKSAKDCRLAISSMESAHCKLEISITPENNFVHEF